MTERQRLIEKKQQIQLVKNRLKQMKGIEVLECFFEDENLALNKMYSAYTFSMVSSDIKPYSRLSDQAAEAQIISWLITDMNLKENTDYFFYCCGTWTKIRLLNLQTGIKSLWTYRGESLKGFMLVNTDFTCIMEACSDSRDEENYLIDIWNDQTRADFITDNTL